MKNLARALASAALLATLAGTALAQGPASGPGPGAGGPRMGPGAGMGPGTGMGPGAGMPRWGQDATPGWGMMSDAERQQHREKMQSLKSHEECKAYMEQHHQQMVERAKAKGVSMPGQPRRDACAGLK